MEYISTNTLKK